MIKRFIIPGNYGEFSPLVLCLWYDEFGDETLKTFFCVAYAEAEGQYHYKMSPLPLPSMFLSNRNNLR